MVSELIFSKGSLYNLTRDPFNLLAIHMTFAPYYLALALYLSLTSRRYNRQWPFNSKGNDEFANLKSPFLTSFGWIGTFGGLIGFSLSLSLYNSLTYCVKIFFLLGGINFIGLFLQNIAIKKTNEVLLSRNVFIMFVLNCLSIIVLVYTNISEMRWRFNFESF